MIAHLEDLFWRHLTGRDMGGWTAEERHRFRTWLIARTDIDETRRLVRREFVRHLVRTGRLGLGDGVTT